MLSRVIYTIAAIILVGMIQLLAGASGNRVVIVVAGALLCLLPYGLWTFRESQADSNLDLYLPGVAAITGILIGGIVRWTVQPAVAFDADLLAVAFGLAGSAAIIIIRLSQRSQRCQLCRRHLTRYYQDCPRCGRKVCERSGCWNSKYYRCLDCEWLQRPLLPLDDPDWWFQRTGHRLSSGTCLRCRQDADTCDLRSCRNCPRAMCVQCWDLENGRCVRCLWRIPELPESLQAFLPPEEASVRARR